MPLAWLGAWRVGFKSLLLHPLRSLLTVVGIFIGVASVIWLLAIGEGISRKAQEQIAGLGAENIIIRSIKPSDDSVTTTAQGLTPYGLTRDDFNRLVNTLPSVERALPIREIRQQFRYADRAVDGRLVGCTPEYADVTQLEVDRGHFISDAENANRRNACVLAAEVAERLFPYEDPLGKAIHVGEYYFEVVGVMKTRQPTAGIGGSLAAQDFSKDVYIPIRTLQERLGDQIVTRGQGSIQGEILELSQITLRVDGVENVVNTAAAVQRTLQQTHRTVDYGVTVPLELLKQAENTRLMFMALLGFIAAISLVVGGIGIMNIMLATVTERTREIGIRRALGAKQGDITRQFLTETVLLSVMGGLTGILGGLACGPVIRFFRDQIQNHFPDLISGLPDVIRTVEPHIVPWSVPLAFGISVGIGVVFGLYPAVRAAAMDPIEALRHE